MVDHRPACRFLMLDAVNQSKQTKFYDRNQFRFLLESDENSITRIMYDDLLKFPDKSAKFNSYNLQLSRIPRERNIVLKNKAPQSSKPGGNCLHLCVANYFNPFDPDSKHTSI
jgi:hypothetical protein